MRNLGFIVLILKCTAFLKASMYDCKAYNEKMARRKLGPGRNGGVIKEDNLSGFDTWQQLFEYYHEMDATYTEARAQQLFEESEPQSAISSSIGRSGQQKQAKVGCGVPTNPMVLHCAGYKNETYRSGPGRSGGYWDPTWHSVNEEISRNLKSCVKGRTDLTKNKWCDKRVVTFAVDIEEIERQHNRFRHHTKPISSLKFKPKKICRAILKALEVWQNAADLEFYEMPFEGQHETCSRLLSESRSSEFCEDRYVDDTLMSNVEKAQIRIGFVHSGGYHWTHNSRCNLAITGSTLAHAYFPSSGDIAGDAHFSIDKAWEYRKSTDPRSSDVDLFLVAVHELGHSLGLSHSQNKQDIMYPMYKYKDWTGSNGPEWWRDILSDWDIQLIQHKYGPQTNHGRKSCFSKARSSSRRTTHQKQDKTRVVPPAKKKPSASRSESKKDTTWEVPKECIWYNSEKTTRWYMPQSCAEAESLDRDELLLTTEFCIDHCNTRKCGFKTEAKFIPDQSSRVRAFDSKNMRCWN